MALARAQCKVQVSRSSRASSVKCHAAMPSAREVMGIALGAVISFSAFAPIANASVVDDLLAKSAANKEINNKKRLATSYANLARSRTVADGTCSFPENFFGCEELALNAGVKYIADDLKLECQGQGAKDCASKPTMRTK